MTTAQRACLAESLVAGSEVLRHGGSSVLAVEATIRVLEASGLFNAGLGARRQLDGVRRMDASIMEGRGLYAGAVASIEQVCHPISAAKLVMEETAHVLLVGRPATRFALHFDLEWQRASRAPREGGPGAPADGRAAQRQTLRLYRALARRASDELGTVGAVALDERGTVAAGVSTGGIAVMLPGRVGDTPLIGCGVYADDEAGAISMTGLGESIMRIVVAKEIADRLAAGAGPRAAARALLKKLVARVRGAAGALVLAPDGRFAIAHTTPYMAAGSWRGRGMPAVADRFV